VETKDGGKTRIHYIRNAEGVVEKKEVTGGRKDDAESWVEHFSPVHQGPFEGIQEEKRRKTPPKRKKSKNARRPTAGGGK